MRKRIKLYLVDIFWDPSTPKASAFSAQDDKVEGLIDYPSGWPVAVIIARYVLIIGTI